ncbi:hypothetical protein WJX72_000708 [[Myrmecia] bisecta]|uniref:Uncharacterized protein n=1 Tax=[Myrmecia] bisecta TaxID=41462 RepID=A0AAW1R4Y2_9CHLO
MSGQAVAFTPAQQHRLLSRGAVLLTYVLLILCTSALILGGVGLYVLTDLEHTAAVSQTLAASYWRRLNEWNPMISTAFVNGGLIGSVMCLKRLQDHREAQKLSGVRWLKYERPAKEDRAGQTARKKDVKKKR